MITFPLRYFNAQSRDSPTSPAESSSPAQSSSASPMPSQSVTTTPKSTGANKKNFQPTIKEAVDRRIKFQPNDYRAQKITNLIGEMICLDIQPFSVVSDIGFQRVINYLEPRYNIPSRKYFSSTKIPEMYRSERENVKLKLEEVEKVSITTDMWTSSANDDYLSLTIHAIDHINFSQLHFCVNVLPFSLESHTSLNISTFITEALEEWRLKNKIVCIVTDNARNITCATELLGYEHIPCLAHTFQLVIKDALEKSTQVITLISSCRRIVGHFKHSTKAMKILKKAQEETNTKEHNLIQDEPTRWNSTLLMLQRLLEQKKALVHVSGEINLPASLKSSDWDMIVNLVNIFDIFNTATLELSKDSITISEVIPMVLSVKNYLQNLESLEGSGLKNLVDRLKASLDERLGNVQNKKIYAVATLLDPRFKDSVFQNDTALESAKTYLKEEMEDQVSDGDVAEVIMILFLNRFQFILMQMKN